MVGLVLDSLNTSTRYASRVDLQTANFVNLQILASEFDFANLNRSSECIFMVDPSVTRLGDLLDFGQGLKAFGNN